VFRTLSPARPSTRPRALIALLLAVCLAGCASTGGVPSYDRLVADLRAGASENWGALDDAFLRLPDFQDRLERVGVLRERSADVGGEDAVGLAEEMLDLWFGDLRAHELRHRLALADGETALATFHDEAVTALVDAVAATGDGSAEDPFEVVSTQQAYAWLDARRIRIAGALYAADDEAGRLVLVVKARRGEGERLEELRFDLSATLDAAARITAAVGETPSPSEIVSARAAQGDSAAQTAHAIDLWHQGAEFAGRAVQWLQAASRSGNLVAREMLGVIYGSLAAAREGEEAEQLLDAAVDQFLLAVNQGSDTAMYNLAQLYLSGHFGAENQPAGVALLRQAADRENLDALVMLARLHYNGQFVSEDRDRAVEILTDAASQGHVEARLFLARHLLSTDDGAGFDERALGWLREAAEPGGSPAAMMLLGTLHAEGEHVEADAAKAVDWFRRAADGTRDAETINSVAWILAVAENHDLRRPEAALELMNALMRRDGSAAANPAYLDTWAAAQAANGAFEAAVTTQEQAVALAREEAERTGEPPEYLEILETHLELFRDGGTVTEDVP
jgi:TPR repeat protein